MVDQYCLRFSGHTQVNATDLRALTYPDRDTLLQKLRSGEIATSHDFTARIEFLRRYA